MHNISTEAPGPPSRRPSWRATRTTISLVALTSLLLACAPPAAPAAPAPAAAPAAGNSPAVVTKPAASPPEPSGSITLAMLEEPPNLQSSESSRNFVYPVLRNVAEALTNRNPRTNELVGELATKWERANPTTWRFTLRQLGGSVVDQLGDGGQSDHLAVHPAPGRQVP